ncbi:MAG: hypothetical protein ABSB53_03615 [Nitrososphaerales archaeon]|jgi:hypothetical protein
MSKQAALVQKMTAEEALVKWTGGEREKWEEYETSVKKYLTVRRLLNEIPSESKFLEDIARVLEVKLSPEESAKLRRIFFNHMVTPVEVERGVGIAIINEGANAYVKRLTDAGYPLTPPRSDEIKNYLILVGTNSAKLFDQPWSNMATRGANYRIVNGNKYIKLLRFLDSVRADNRAGLSKYHKLEGEYESIEPEVFNDEYALYRFGTVILKLYCFANLHRRDVHIYNSKTEEVGSLYGSIEVEDFGGLFKFFQSYEQFVKARYALTWLDKQPDFVKMITSVSI